MNVPIKIILIEPNRIDRLGLRKLLSVETIEIVGEAATATAGMDLMRKKKPDIALCATDLPDLTAVDLCEWMCRHFQKTKSIFLLKTMDIPLLIRLFHTSAKGFLLQDSSYLNVEVIKTVAEGKTYIQPDLALEIFQRSTQTTEKLSHREYQVLDLIKKGCSHEAIAERLHIATKTVFNVKYRGFKKLGIETVTQLHEIFQRESH